MKISHYAVKHPVVIAMILIALVAFGAYSIVGMSLEFIPDISLPEVEVITIYPGASAEDVEQDVTKVLEDEFVTLPNFKSMSSQSANSISWITVIYNDGVDVNDQLTELRFRIDDLVDDLPDDAEKPYALVGGATMLPIMQFAITGGQDGAKITDYINDTLKPKLTKIDGVADVTVYGNVEPQVNVKLRMDDVASKGISVLQVYQVLKYSNFSMPLGKAEWQDHTINAKYNGKIQTLDELRDLPVGMGNDNVMVRLSDIADVTFESPKDEIYILSEGSNQVIVELTKRASANSVNIIKQVKKVLGDLNKDTDGALNYRIISDDSKSISDSLSNVLDSGISGVIIAVIVIFLFMNNPKSTIIIGSAIPLSFLFAFIAMKISGQTINLITTAAFVVALGMVVDASTVMLEEVSRYLGKPEFSTDEAIMRGADEVGASILASAMTTIVVFIPICFLKGIVGMILNSFALVLIFCISASLIVAIVFVPFMMKTIMGGDVKQPKKTKFMKGIDWLEEKYKKGLGWSLAHTKYTLIVPTILLALSFMLVFSLGFSFLPSVDNGDFYVNLEMPTGYSLDQTKEKALKAANMVQELVPENSGITLYVGMNNSMGGNFTTHPDNAYMYVSLQSGKRRKVQKIIEDVQYQLSANIPDCKVTATNGGFDKLLSYVSGGGGYKLILQGTDLHELYAEAEKIRDVLAQQPEVTTTSIDTNFDELLLTMDMNQDNLNSLGITTYEAGMVNAILFNGVDIGNMTLDSDRENIRLLSDMTDTQLDEQSLARIPIKTLSGNMVTMQELGNIKVGNTVSSIKHTDRSPSVTVGATLVSEDTSGVTLKVIEYLLRNPLPDGIETKNGGIVGLITDSLANIVAAVIIAVFLLYMVMVIQFERFSQPLIIMVSVPFCLIGVIICLLVFNSSITLMSVIALISLAGTVVNNAIILIDYINQIRDKKRAAIMLGISEDLVNVPGSDVTSECAQGRLLDVDTEKKILHDSIVEGGSSRLKPILITTLTTIVGVIPMALAIGEGSELYASVGQSIAGGLLTSTLITLFIVPAIYSLSESNALVRHKKRSLIRIARQKRLAELKSKAASRLPEGVNDRIKKIMEEFK